jgi:hypothetical protein
MTSTSSTEQKRDSRTHERDSRTQSAQAENAICTDHPASRSGLGISL